MSHVIFDAFTNKTNHLNGDEVKDIFIKTLNLIIDVLAAHCGPNAQYAVFTSQDIKFESTHPKFTKDGVNIIRNMEFVSPVQSFIQKFIVYIGDRIEAHVGDGTTTSMILVCKFIIEMITNLKQDNYSNTLISNYFNKYIDQLLNVYEQKIYTVEKIMDICNVDKPTAIAKIAYMQAMTSSHGDSYLSELVAEFFKGMDDKQYNSIFIEQSERETNTPLTINRSEIGSYELAVGLENINAYNTDSNNACEFDDCILFAVNGKIAMNANNHKQLYELITDKNRTKPVVAIATGFAMDIIDISTKYDNVALFTCLYELHYHLDYNDIVGLNHVCGIQPLYANNYTECIQLVENTHCYYKNNKLILTGLYENTNPDSLKHPSVEDSSKINFNMYLANLQHVIDDIRNDPNNNNVRYLNAYLRLYNKVAFKQASWITIGGGRYQNSTYYDILEDTIKAVKRSIDHGFVQGACSGLLSALSAVNYTYSKVSIPSELNIVSYIYSSLFNAIILVRDILFNNDTMKTYSPENVYNLFDLVDAETDDDMKSSAAPVLFSDYIKQESYSEFNYPVIQPANLDKEFLKRLNELALKIISTNTIIAVGGVFNKDDNDKGW